MKQTICILCGNNDAVRELYPATFSEKDLNRETYSARRLPDRIHYRMVKCAGCGLIFSNPILPAEKIAGLYHESVCTYDTQVEYITTTYVDLFSKLHVAKNAKILEVGCGNGFFLKALFDHGIKKVYGVEPGEDMVNNAHISIRKNIKKDIFRKNQFPEKSFDTVCCFHTLDHLADPVLFVKEAYRILKPGGYVLVVVHDTGGLSVKLFGEKSPIFDIEHIYLFSKKTIAMLFEKFGFTTVTAASLVNRYPLSYWVRMAGIPGSVKRLALSVLGKTGIGNINISLAGGNMYYVGRKDSVR